jgi:multimeric flavodoxin WrbA
MKVVAFNGSPRRTGNTSTLINTVLEQLRNEGIETELFQLGTEAIHGCIACYKCFEAQDKSCSVKNDSVNAYISKMLEADGIILGSPTYFSDVSATMKALIERAGMVAKANEDMFKGKVGAAVVAVRRAGATHVFSTLNYFFLIGQMIVPGSSYWNLGIGREIGDVQQDEEGLRTMRVLGQNMAWLLKKIHASE